MARRSFNHLTLTKRLQLEALLKAKTSIKKIAKILNVHISTIYREVKRGRYEHLNAKDWTTENRYSPDIAHEKYLENLAAKGAPIKLGKDYALVDYIENRIINYKLSPAAVLGEIKHKNLKFNTSLCVNTLYSYIKKGIFYNLSLKHLPNKVCNKKHKRKIRFARPPQGTSIEYRSNEILSRNTFGHWEMDCVVGKQNTRNVLLVFSERKTRYEIIFRIPNRKSETVVGQLNKLERQYGKNFRKVFKTITVDNGVEFSDFKGLEKSIYNGKRTNIYYCHPYCSSERGTNERLNREIRRLIPKGSDLSKYSQQDILRVQNWINTYPRGIFNYATSAELFNFELSKII